MNFVVGVVGWDRDYSDRCLEVGIEEGVPVAVVSQGSPQVYTPRLKEAGVKVIHVGSTVRHVQKAEEAGVDAAIVSGTEGGGHSGFDQMTTLCLVPQATDAVKIPVIAGGGIVDARGMVAALALECATNLALRINRAADRRLVLPPPRPHRASSGRSGP
mgnify:CR=1 FL=1